MNWRIFTFLISTVLVCFGSQAELGNEHYSSDIIYAEFYEPYDCATISSDTSTTTSVPSHHQSAATTDYTPSYTTNMQTGLSTTQSHNRAYQPHHSLPSFNPQLALASICQSWSIRDFAHEIECNINHCMAYGYSRQQAEKAVLQQYELYVFPNFIANIKQLENYRLHIKNLYHTLLNNQGKFYRLRRALRCVNRGYLQLCDVTERLYNEIVAQEKSEQAQSKSVSSRDKNMRQQEIVPDRQEAARNTFDAQRNVLACEFDEWKILREIYQEEQVGDTKRIERRIQALKVINDGQVLWTEQTYTLSTSAATLLQKFDSNSALYTTNYGNQLQQAIHQECINGIECLAALQPSNTMYPYRQGIAQCFDAARSYNQAGLTSKASTVTDFCWALLDCGTAIAEGFVDGVIGAVKDMAEHPVQTVICVVAGEYVLAYQLSKVLYNIADIGMTALSDADRARQKWDEYVAPVTQLIDAITHQQLTLCDTLRGATQFAVQWKTQERLLKGLNFICTTAKVKAIEYAKNNPLSTPQEYMATPEGFLFKSMNEMPPSGSSLKYERSSRFFVSNHAEITALTKYAQKAMQPPREILQVIGRDFINVTESFLKHIFAAELKAKSFLTGAVERSLSGFHHFVPEHLEEMGISLVNTRTCNKTGIIIADVLCGSHLEPNKTFFPPSWNRMKTIEKLGEAVRRPIDLPVRSGTRVRFFGKTSEGIIVRVVVDVESGNYITAYPDAHANGLI